LSWRSDENQRCNYEQPPSRFNHRKFPCRDVAFGPLCGSILAARRWFCNRPERDSVTRGWTITGESALETSRRLDSVRFEAHQPGTVNGRSWPLPGPATPLGFMHALDRRWEAVKLGHSHRSARPRCDLASAARTDALKSSVRTGCAKRALKGTDPGQLGVQRQVAITTFAVRAEP
jgi:hypothetical protein